MLFLLLLSLLVCVSSQSCSELASNFCSTNLTVFNESRYYDSCPVTCDTAWCCRPPRTCSEASGDSCPVNKIKVLDSRNCTDCATECCLPPQTCGQLFGLPLSYNFCYMQNKRPTQNSTLLYTSCGGPCDASACCEIICNSAAAAVSCVAPTSYFDFIKPCTTCDVAECCRAPHNCREPSLHCNASEGPTDANCTTCDSAECCLPFSSCSVAGQFSNLPSQCEQLGLAIDYAAICTGMGCNTSTCCRPPENCYQVPSTYCQSAKLLLNQSASCPGGICSIASCCRAPQTCYEATSIEYLCVGLGTVTSNSCSPTGCTTSQCCRLPETCLETLFATSNFDNVPRFCLREGFADNFWGNCSGNCTTAECCLPNTCNTWRSGASTRDVCPSGLVLDTNLPCDEDGCRVETCCRSPAHCNETIYRFLCPVGSAVVDTSCSSSSCNQATCCAPARTCQEVNANNLFCAAAGMTVDVMAGACNGTCTTSQCCSPPTSCYYSILGCPQGTFNTGQRCQGAQCSVNTCCSANFTCANAWNLSTSFCDGYGFYAGTDSYHCGTKCTQQMCCRRSKTCGEVDMMTGLCGGAVEYFKPCQGAQCTKSFCCRPPVNCKEAIASGSLVCGSQVATNLNSLSCPGSVCDTTYCCKAVATCGDHDRLVNRTLCGSSMVLNAVKACGGAVPCDVATCCKTPLTCGEAGITCTANTIFNDVACGPCTSTQCCRKPVSCGEAYLNNKSFCGRLTFISNMPTTACVDCIMECCQPPSPTTPTTPVPTAPVPTPYPTDDSVSGSVAVSSSVVVLAWAVLCVA